MRRSRLTREDSIGVYAVGNLVYVTAADGLWVVDTTDASEPQLVSHVDTTSNSWDVVVSGTTAYVGHGGGALTTFDVSDPSNPQPLGHVFIGDWSNPVDFQLIGDRLYSAVSCCLSVFDVTDLYNPAPLASAPLTAGSGVANQIHREGGYVYVTTRWQGLLNYSMTCAD